MLAGMHLGKNSYIYNQTLKNTEAEGTWVQSLIDAGKASKENSRAFAAARTLSEKLDKGPVNLKDAMDAARVIDKAVDQDLMSRSAEVIGKRLLTEEGRPALETAIAVVEQHGNKYMQELASRLKTQENIDPTEAGQVFLEAERIYSSQTDQKTALAPREVTEDMTELEKSAARAGVSEKVTRRMQGVSDALGREIRFYSKAAATYERNGKTYKSTENGYYDPETGILYVNANAKNPFMQVMSHELTHDLENTKYYSQKTEERKQQEAQKGPVSVLKADQLNSAGDRAVALSEKKFELTPLLKKSYGTYDNYLNNRMVTESGFYSRPEVPFAVTNLYNQMNNARTLAETAMMNLQDAQDKYLNTKKAQEIYKNAKPSFSAEMYSRVPSPLENDTVRNYETQFGLAQKAYNSYLDYAEQYGAAAEALQKADDEWRSHVRPKGDRGTSPGAFRTWDIPCSSKKTRSSGSTATGPRSIR